MALCAGPVSGKYALEPARLYSEAIVAGNLAFLSGVGASEDSTTIEEATAEVLTTLNETLSVLGGSLDNAIKASVFLDNISNFQAMNSIYSTFFSSNPPARTTVQATNPGGSLIEIDIVAHLPEGAGAAAA